MSSSRLSLFFNDYGTPQSDTQDQQSTRFTQSRSNSQNYYNNNKYQQYQNYQNYPKQKYSKQSQKALDSISENASPQNRSLSDYHSNSSYSVNRSSTNQYTSQNSRFNQRSKQEEFRDRSFQGGDFNRRTYQTDANNSRENQKHQDDDQFQEQAEKDASSSSHDEMLINFADYDEHENELYYDESETIAHDIQQEDETFVEFVDIEIKCFNCNDVFIFRSKLHKHLRDECITNCSKFSTKFEVTTMSVEIEISLESHTTRKTKIVSSIVSTKDKGFDLVFRN